MFNGKCLSSAHLAMDACHIPRFWDKVIRQGPSECWNWSGSKSNDGYGQFGIRGYVVKAHRVSWKLFYGDIPDGLFVLHRCNNPSCVNPHHLYLGNNSDNMRDRTKDGYNQKEVLARRGHKSRRVYVRSMQL